MVWVPTYYIAGGRPSDSMLHLASCMHCQERTVWRNLQKGDVWKADEAELICPGARVGAPPHPDMPEDRRWVSEWQIAPTVAMSWSPAM